GERHVPAELLAGHRRDDAAVGEDQAPRHEAREHERQDDEGGGGGPHAAMLGARRAPARRPMVGGRTPGVASTPPVVLYSRSSLPRPARSGPGQGPGRPPAGRIREAGLIESGRGTWPDDAAATSLHLGG